MSTTEEIAGDYRAGFAKGEFIQHRKRLMKKNYTCNRHLFLFFIDPDGP